MSQRKRLEDRVNEIMDKHLKDMRFGSPDAPGILAGGQMQPLPADDAVKLAEALKGSGMVKDFLDDLLKGIPVPILIAKYLRRDAKTGKGGCYGMSCLPEGGAIGEAQRTGLRRYQDFMKQRKEAGLTYKDALAMWRAENCDAKPCKGKKRRPRAAEERPAVPLRGLAASVDAATQTDDARLAEDIEDRMLQGLQADEPEWNEEEAFQELQDLGMGRSKKARKPRAPLSEAHSYKLWKGQYKYQDIMSQLKAKGATHKEALEMYRQMKTKGGSFWSDFKDGFMSVVETAAPLVPLLL